MYKKGRKYKRAVIIALLCFGLGFVRMEYEEVQCRAYQEALTYQGKIQLQGQIIKKENSNNNSVVYLDHVYLQIEHQIYHTSRVLVYLSEDVYPIGKTILLEGNIKQLRAAVNEGNYNERAYYESLGIYYHVQADHVYEVRGKTNFIANSLYLFKEKLKLNYTKNLSEENAGIMTTMLLGDKELLDKELKGTYQQAGIAHMLVISGMHISIIGMLIFGMLKRISSFALSGSVAVLLLWLYVCMIGEGISAQRALFMFGLLMLGKMTGRSYDSLTGLALALILLLTEQPRLITYAGLQFSVAAILGVTVVAPVVQKVRTTISSAKLATYTFLKRIIRTIGTVILVPLVIQIMTLPLVARYYYEVPVYAVLLNCMIVPLLSLVLINGIVLTIACFIPFLHTVHIAWPLERILNGISYLSGKSIELPCSSYITGTWSVGRIVLFYVIFVVLLYLLSRSQSEKEELYKKGTGVCRSIVLICFLLVIVYPKHNNKLYAFLDVGQGDGIYIHTENDQHLMIDGGSTDVKEVGKYRILPFLKYNGIRTIDYWFVSHYDTDHVSGLLEALEAGYRIQCVMLPREEAENMNYRAIIKQAEKAHTKVLYFNRGQSIHMGEAVLHCIFPKEEYQGADENAFSMVLLYEEGTHRALFTGDMGETEEAWLLSHPLRLDTENVELTQIELLKAAHHGSNYSNSSSWLNQLEPTYTILSCSARNRYGHPGEDAVERLLKTGSQLYYTMKSGQISVYRGKPGIRIESYLEVN